MSLDGFAVGDACVVTPSGGSLGESAIAVWASRQQVFFDTTLGVTDWLTPLPGTAYMVSWGSGQALQFLAQRVNQGDNLPVLLMQCDSGMYPVRGLDALAPDVPTALVLSAAVVLVWTAGFGFRMLRKALDTGEVDRDGE